MALVSCSECGKQVSDKASNCTNCGCPVEVSSKNAVEVKHNYAGFAKRVIASIIDVSITLVVGAFIGYIIGIVFESKGFSLRAIGAISSIVGAILGWLYYSLMESSERQATIGKASIGIIVTDLQGNRISFGKATGRYLGKIISSITFCIGYLMVFFTKKKQGLHDLVAGTLVVNK
jgi:uncharacterized RDD family membrane protein YckC